MNGRALDRLRRLVALYDEIALRGPQSAWAAASHQGQSQRKGHVLMRPLRDLGLVEYTLANSRPQLRLTRKGKSRERAIEIIGKFVGAARGLKADTAREIEREVCRLLGRTVPPPLPMPSYLEDW